MKTVCGRAGVTRPALFLAVLRRTHAAASLVGLTACTLIGLAACAGGGSGSGRATPPGSSSPAGAGRPRIVIVGLDGADWSVILPLVKRGRLPSFARLLREGTTGILRSEEPSASPSLWTTIATGVHPERHGIHGFVVGGEGPDGAFVPGMVRTGPAADSEASPEPGAGAVRPVTSTMRRAPAFWNILPHFGFKVGVVGWLVTWPAEPVDGYIVSSYLPYIYNWSTGRPLKGTIIEGIPRQTFPEGLVDQLEPLKVKPADLSPEMVRRFYDPAKVRTLSADVRECVLGFRWSLACDETYRRIGLHLFETYPVDLFAVYFGGVDVASHRFWKFANPGALDYHVGAGEAAALGGVIEEYYAYADGLVGEYLARLGPNDTLVVLSDHGFKPVLFPGRPNTSGHHRLEGIVAIWGRGARRGARLDEAPGLVDVLPTLCVLLGVPIARDLEGRAIEAALDPVFLHQHEARFVDRYDLAGAAGGPDQSNLDRNVLERLRSLGYIN